MANSKHVKWDVRQTAIGTHVTRTEVSRSTSTSAGRRTSTTQIKTSQKTAIKE